MIHQALDKIQFKIDPEDFFRTNRQFIISRRSVKKVVQHFSRKLKLHLSPAPDQDVFVSKDKATPFKEWLE